MLSIVQNTFLSHIPCRVTREKAACSKSRTVHNLNEMTSTYEFIGQCTDEIVSLPNLENLHKIFDWTKTSWCAFRAVMGHEMGET